MVIQYTVKQSNRRISVSANKAKDKLAPFQI